MSNWIAQLFRHLTAGVYVIGVADGERRNAFTASWRTDVTGAPLPLDALAHFDCRVTGDIEAGDHRLIVGRVVDGALAGADGDPLIYAQTGNLDMSEDVYPETFS
ncbi:flavin reductase [Paraburkholderia sp. MM5482-R1]|uniref:flavin reductase n=1 Tax=unclassified Paraburkholderia TaxID=2615204 RepID=UPI003D1DA6AC